MSHVRYLCLFAYSGVQHILCWLSSSCVLYMVVSNTYCVVWVFFCLRLVSCVPNVASFSGLSILHSSLPFCFSNIYLGTANFNNKFI